MNNYLIPANSKKGLLILGVFNHTDAIIFALGLTVTFFLLILFPPEILFWTVLEIIPVLTAGMLVFPIPNYHNALNLLLIIIEFVRVNQKLEWKGWEYERVYQEDTQKK